jgi:hypothetical protein
MTKTNKILTAVAIVATAAVSFGSALVYYGSENAILERYPHLDPEIARAAHRKMFAASLRGEFADLDLNDDAVCEAIFLGYVRQHFAV